MPEDKSPVERVIPPDLKPLTDEEFNFRMDEAFIPGHKCWDGEECAAFCHDAYKRILLALDLERQNVARLRHWVAMAGSNTAKPTTEAKVSFIAMSAALDLIMGTPEDLRDAISLLETAVTQVALSQAGKLDLDVVEWAARDLEHQKKKPMVNMLLGHGPFHVLDGKPDASSGAVEVHPRQGAPVHAYDEGTVTCPECGLIPGQLKGPYCMKCGRINGSPS